MANNVINMEIDAVLGTGRLSGVTFKEAMEIPDAVCQLIPAREAAIPLLLEHDLPPELDASEVDLVMGRDCFIDSDPSWSVTDLASSPIPPFSWAGLFGTELRSRWGTGKLVGSIQHPSNPTLLFPVWVGTYWDKVLFARREKGRWERALKWLQEQEVGALREGVIDIIGRIPWGLELRSEGHPDPDRLVGNVATLLSWGWVRETHLELAAEMFNNACTSNWLAADPYLARRVVAAAESSQEEIRNDTTLATIVNLVEHHRARNLIFPVNMANVHWIVFSVDLVKYQITHGAYLTSRHRRPYI